MYKEKKKNLIILIVFSAVFCTALGFSLSVGNKPEIDALSATDFSSETVVRTITVDTNNAVAEATNEYEEYLETQVVESQENAAELTLTAFTVTEYETVAKMFASDTVNVRAGAGTDYDRIGKVAWGTEMEVTGVTDNGWFEVLYKDLIGYIRGDYMVDEMPGIPYLFVGDSRTVQMQLAVGSTDKAYIAKIGEGYSYFKNTALAKIPSYAGQGTVMIINFGVNDLANASKYIKLVNDNIDTWENAGITVYYSSVTPVGSCNVSNAEIEDFNAKLQSGLDPRVHWIDSYSYLLQTGYSTNDGLHYSRDTYKNLYSYYMSVISQQI